MKEEYISQARPLAVSGDGQNTGRSINSPPNKELPAQSEIIPQSTLDGDSSQSLSLQKKIDSKIPINTKCSNTHRERGGIEHTSRESREMTNPISICARKAVCDTKSKICLAVSKHHIDSKEKDTGVRDRFPITLVNRNESKEELGKKLTWDFEEGEILGESITENHQNLHGSPPHNRRSPFVMGGLCSISISPSWANVARLSGAKKDFDTKCSVTKSTAQQARVKTRYLH